MGPVGEHRARHAPAGPLRAVAALALLTTAIGKPAIAPLLLAGVVGLLLLQNRIDRRDRQFGAAPVGPEPALDFGPVLGSRPEHVRALGGGALR